MYTNNLTFFINEIPTYEDEVDINIYDKYDNLIDNYYQQLKIQQI